jgi:hypothetical protein
LEYARPRAIVTQPATGEMTPNPFVKLCTHCDRLG